jgi:transposase-like protein
MDDQERVRWVKLVADFESSDLTQREFASERGVSFANLRNWIYKLRKETRPLVSEASKEPGQEPAPRKGSSDLQLRSVRMVASAAKRRTTELAQRDGDNQLELVLRSGVRLRFPVGTDLGYLQAIAAAL